MKKLLASLLAAVMIASAFAAVLPASAADPVFSDVNKSTWSYDSIMNAVRAGYMQGVCGGRFDPEGSLTRAMVVTVLWRREGSPAPQARHVQNAVTEIITPDGIPLCRPGKDRDASIRSIIDDDQRN